MRAIARTEVGLVLLSVLAVAAGVVAGPAAADVTGNATVTVTDVVDGDTVDVRYENGSTDTVRLLGIDAPAAIASIDTSTSPTAVRMVVRMSNSTTGVGD